MLLLRQRYPAAYGRRTLLKVLALFPGSGHLYKSLYFMSLAALTLFEFLFLFFFLVLFTFLSFTFVIFASLRPGYAPELQDMYSAIPFNLWYLQVQYSVLPAASKYYIIYSAVDKNY